MLYGVQTHFDGLIGDHVCHDLYVRQFRVARLDCQVVTIDVMLSWVSEVMRAGLFPHVVVATPEHIEALPDHTLPIWRNETDHGRFHPMPAEDYAREFIRGCDVARRSPCRLLGGPAVSGTHKRGVDYTEAVVAHCGGTLPENAVGVIARYGFNNGVSAPNRLSKWRPCGVFRSRDDEYVWFQRTIGGGRPWGIGEVGWATIDGFSEEKQAAAMRYEFVLAETHGAAFCDWFQLHDGANPDSPSANDHFGIRRNDGHGKWSWKPAADIPSHLVEERA